MTFPDNSGNTAIHAEQAGPAEQVGPVSGEDKVMTNQNETKPETVRDPDDFRGPSGNPEAWPEPAVASPPAPAPVVNPLENEDMIRSLLAKIADALVGASSLSKRVVELQSAVDQLGYQVDDLAKELRVERDYAKSLDYDLTNTKAALKASQDYATECEKEIDTLKRERDDAVQGRAAALEDVRLIRNTMDTNEQAYTESFDHWTAERDRVKAENEALKAQVQKQSDKIVRMLGALQE